MKRGFYIVFEGVVGTGKTTHAKKLFEFLKKTFPRREIVWTREPGGGEIGEAIRKLVQATPFREEMDAVCEAYLYAASRAQTLRRVPQPVLKRGGLVISDRSFITSLAYQGFARKLGVEKTLEINKIAVEEAQPDLILFLKLSPEEGLKRASDREGDKWEGLDLEFFKKVEKGYEKISKLPQFKKRWINVPADREISDVFYKILKRI